VPTLRLRAAANEHRAALRSALSALLDLTVISLAGGAGLEQSLDDAANVGQGAAARRLRDTLAEARLTRTTPWHAFSRLGADTGVPELEQLAAAVGLAGSEGAKVRTSLTARAAAMRARQVTDAEADAASATERMSLPTVGLFAGYLLLIGYPAVAAVMAGL
jgi:Flp pilus assembly protein TadB